MSDLALSVLLPVRNETLNLKIMLKILSCIVNRPHEVIVIVDDEEDQSIAITQQAMQEALNIRYVVNRYGPGIPNALKTGVEAANGERILIFAADEIGPLLAIEEMMKLMDQGCEFISCTRYARGGKRVGGSLIGHFCSYTANKLLRLVSSIAFTDSTTGIKMFYKKDFNKLIADSEDSAGWSIAFYLAINAQLNKLHLGEVPIFSIDRLFGGESSFKLIPWIKAYLKYFLIAVKKLPKLRRRQSIKFKIPANLK